MRPALPEAVTVTAAHHPLAGLRLAVEGRRAVGGEACWIVRLSDGTPATLAVSATSAPAAAGDGSAPTGGLLSVEGVRRLRGLLAAVASGADGSGT